MGTKAFFDLETNGLLDTVSVLHCAVIIDEQDQVFRYTPGEGRRFLKMLDTYDEIIGHNIIRYDLPVLAKLFDGWTPRPEVKITDTITMARLARADIKDSDFALQREGKIPGKLMGSHSLEAWGYRLGKMKGEYTAEFKQRLADQGIEYTQGAEWATFSQEMLDYNVQDVVVTKALYDHLREAYVLPVQALEIEHDCAHIMAEQERNGFPFNMKAAQTLYATLVQRRIELERACAELFHPWAVSKGIKVAAVNSKSLGYVKGVAFTPIEIIVFNPSSRAHIADRLKALYGWEPTEFTDKGAPKVDEVTLGKLDYPPCKLLTEYLLVDKRIGQLAEGNQSWFRHYNSQTGCIHGTVNTCGAVTGRATHAFPNVAQVPASRSPYGHDCRALFGAPAGWVLAGTDAAGLELRCLAHYMAKWDNGEYGREIISGDIHTANQKAAGLPTRDNAKTFIYAFLYGAGDEKIGSIIGKGRKAGGIIKQRFLAGLPALGKLDTAVKQAAKRGYLIGLDGRRVAVRSEHAALNTLLQGAGALVCKKWLIEVYNILRERGFVSGIDFRFQAWVHDELQVALNATLHPTLPELFPAISQEAMERAAAAFDFRCPLGTDCKVGANWAETH